MLKCCTKYSQKPVNKWGGHKYSLELEKLYVAQEIDIQTVYPLKHDEIGTEENSTESD